MNTCSDMTSSPLGQTRKNRSKLTLLQKELLAQLRKTLAQPRNQRRLEAFLSDLSSYIVKESIRELLSAKEAHPIPP